MFGGSNTDPHHVFGCLGTICEVVFVWCVLFAIKNMRRLSDEKSQYHSNSLTICSTFRLLLMCSSFPMENGRWLDSKDSYRTSPVAGRKKHGTGPHPIICVCQTRYSQSSTSGPQCSFFFLGGSHPIFVLGSWKNTVYHFLRQLWLVWRAKFDGNQQPLVF